MSSSYTIEQKALVSKGYENSEALKFSETGESVCFRVSIPHYDANAEDKTYWENATLKAYGSVCEEIKRLGVKAGSWISFVGKKIIGTFPDNETGEIKKKIFIKVLDVSYASSGNGRRANSDEDGEDEEQPAKPKATAKTANKPATTTANPKKSATESDNFEGYTPIAGYDDFC